jgi:hypothetical protein
MTNKTGLALSFVVAAIATAQLGASRDANAFTQYTNGPAAGRCTSEITSTGTLIVDSGSMVNQSTDITTKLILACAVVDSTALRRDQIAHVSVDVTDGQFTTTVSASACLQHTDQTVTCSAAATGTGFGHFALSPSPAVWSGAGYPYIVVAIPGGGSSLNGFSVTN